MLGRHAYPRRNPDREGASFFVLIPGQIDKFVSLREQEWYYCSHSDAKTGCGEITARLFSPGSSTAAERLTQCSREKSSLIFAHKTGMHYANIRRTCNYRVWTYFSQPFYIMSKPLVYLSLIRICLKLHDLDLVKSYEGESVQIYENPKYIRHHDLDMDKFNILVSSLTREQLNTVPQTNKRCIFVHAL
ncbi:hypothetical protein MPTK2_2g12640 [Marchantia polymorpha subsp. ruderalis]